MDAGNLPIIGRLVDRGVSGALAPGGLAEPAFWATVATGLPPSRHGITHHVQERPDRGGVGPVNAASWHVPPLWQALASRGIPVVLAGGPATAPAVHWAGCTAVDERFAASPSERSDDWPLPPGCVSPAGLRRVLRPLRVHPGELLDADRDGLPAGPLAEAAGLHAAATHLAGQAPWRLLIVHHGLLLESREDAAYKFMDAMVGSLLHLAGPGADIVLVSSEGVLVAAGPGFEADGILHGAGPADVHATVLARLGFRQAGSAGRILPGTAYAALDALDPAPIPTRPWPAPILPSDPAAAAAITAAEQASALQLATAAIAAQDFASAAPVLRDILRQDANHGPALLLLGQCAIFLGLPDEAGAAGHKIVAQTPGLPWGHLLCGAALALGGDLEAADPFLRAAEARGTDDPFTRVRIGAVALRCGLPQAARRQYEAALALDPGSAEAQAGLGLTAAAEGDPAEAERRLRSAIGMRFHAPALHYQLGAVLAAARRWPEASASLRTALSQQPGLPGATELIRAVEDAAVRTLTGEGRRRP